MVESTEITSKDSSHAVLGSEDTPSPAEAYCILALYKFFTLPSPASEMKLELEGFLKQRDVRGLLLLADQEGVNGTISFPCHYQEEIESFLKGLFLEIQGKTSHDKHPQDQYKHLRLCVSHGPKHVFNRFKIKIRKEIVSMGLPMNEIISSLTIETAYDSSQSDQSEAPNCASCESGVGIYVPPGPQWDRLLHDPECLVIDTRNDYEVALGTFRNAVNPHTTHFKEFPDFFARQQGNVVSDRQYTSDSDPEHCNCKQNSSDRAEQESKKFNKVAMFCTGYVLVAVSYLGF